MICSAVIVWILFPSRGEGICGSVVTSNSVNATLNENELVLLVLVFPELLQVLAHNDSFLDEVVEILRDSRGEGCSDISKEEL